MPPLATARVPVTVDTDGVCHVTDPAPFVTRMFPDEPVEAGKVLAPSVMEVVADRLMVPDDCRRRFPEVPDPMIFGVVRSVRKVGDVRKTPSPDPVAEVCPVPPLAIGKADPRVSPKVPKVVMVAESTPLMRRNPPVPVVDNPTLVTLMVIL